MRARDEQIPGSAAGPEVLRRFLGVYLRDLRQHRSLTLGQVADQMLVSEAKLSRLENAERLPQPRDVRDLAAIYGLDPLLARQLITLAKAARERGWWQDFPTLPSPERSYLGLETGATSLLAVNLLLVHGLAQTSAYTRAMLSGLGRVTSGWAPERVEQIVESRAARQARIEEPNPLRADIVIGETALRARVGSAKTMRDQVDHLIRLTELPNVRLRLLPVSSAITAGHVNSFGLLGFAGGSLPDIACIETLTSNAVFESKADVELHRAGFDSVVEAALSPDETRESFEAIRAGWEAATQL